MKPHITEKTVRQFVNDISDEQYVMPGTVIAASAAQAVALGEACMQISLDNQVDKLDWQDIMSRIEQMVHIKNMLIEWSDQEANASAKFHAFVPEGNGHLRQVTQTPPESPVEMARLSLQAIQMLKDFRPLAFRDVSASLDIAVYLLAGTARAALCLLNTNLSYLSDAKFQAEYRLIASTLQAQIDQVTVLN